MKAARYNPSADILSAITVLDTGDKIRAYFRNGQDAVYSGYMIDLLKTDSGVKSITSEVTGEILYYADRNSQI